MLTEPELDRAALTAALHRDFGLTTSTMRFLPRGETAWCYQVTDERGGRWFAKLTRPAAVEPGRAESGPRLAGALADLGLPVPSPLRTLTGRLWSWLEGLRLVVFQLVDGDRLSDRDLWAAELLEPLASLVAAVHGATDMLAMPIPCTETFTVWARGLHGRLAELRPAAGTAGRRAEARALVWPRRAELLAMLEHVQALGELARSRQAGRVLCHGDLIGDNLLRDRTGRLWLVDWDGATLAPRELDLSLFAGPGIERFLDSYERATGPVDLDPDLIAYFLLRRNLEDLVDWLGAALSDGRPNEQRHADLDGVRWCLSRWGELQARIQHIDRVLAGRQPRHGR